MKNLISIFTMLFFTTCLSYSYEGGNGRTDNPYQISKPEHLVKLSNTVGFRFE